MKKLADIQNILSDVNYKDWTFRVSSLSESFFIQVQFTVIDEDTQLPEIHRGRKWYINSYMTRSEIVQTAFLAVMVAEEHETRNNFRYKNKAIFCPLYNADELVAFSEKADFDVQENHTSWSANDLDF